MLSLPGGLPSARPSLREVGGGRRSRAGQTQRAEENRLRPFCFVIPHGSFPSLPFHFITEDKCDLLISRTTESPMGRNLEGRLSQTPTSGFRSSLLKRLSQRPLSPQTRFLESGNSGSSIPGKSPSISEPRSHLLNGPDNS